jgi:hypothetical protein
VRRSSSLLVLLVFLSAGCALSAGKTATSEVAAQSPVKENMTMSRERSSSRPAPAAVAPVSRDGVRYEQVMNGLSLGLGTLTGNLAAYDAKSGERLWTLSVYATAVDDRREADVQAVYFSTMEFDGAGKLKIVNERGDAFLVDVKARTVKPVAK